MSQGSLFRSDHSLNRVAALVPTLIVVIGVGWAVSRLIETVSLTLAAPHSIEPAIDAPLTSSLPSAKEISRLGWFGFAPEDMDTDSGSLAGSDLTAKYELRGVSSGGKNEAFSGAFIAMKGQPEDYFKVGDELPGHEATLVGVFPTYVVLKHGQDLVSLKFPGTQEISDLNVAPPSGGASPYILLPPDPPQSKEDPSLGSIAKQFIADPAKLLSEAGLKPVAAGEKQGYVFSGNDSDGVFAGTDLQAGDVVTSVNGTAVGDVKGDRLLVPGLMTSQTVDMGVRRGDKNITIHYTMP